MIAPRFLFLAAALSTVAGAGCSLSTHNTPCLSNADCPANTTCASGGCQPGTCPPLEPTFDSIDTKLFKGSCVFSSCHSTTGSSEAGGLDLEADPYHALLGSDGKGAPAKNMGVMNGPPLLRVKPGDPDGSLLVHKLEIGDSDPMYGQGMPLGAAGTVCQGARDAIRQWILCGAPQVGTCDGGTVSDGGSTVDAAGSDGSSGDAAGSDGSASVDGGTSDAPAAVDATSG